ncbi:MAG: hypothetical protein R3B84_15250 [Zavarzinella sp.]
MESLPYYSGHVRNGVIILDDNIPLVDGQAVRIELLPEKPASENNQNRAAQLKLIFDQWDQEDEFLSDEQAELLQQALQETRGVYMTG